MTPFAYLCCCIVLLLSLFQLSQQALAPTRISEPWNHGAQCVNLSSIPDSVLLSCRSYLTYDMVYVDDLQAARESVWVQAQVLVVTNDACSYSAFRQICVSSFRPCYEVTEPNTNETFWVGGFPCRVLCEDVATNCFTTAQNLFHQTEAVAKAFLSCYPVGNHAFYGFPTVDVFPPGNYTLQLDGQNITGNPLASSNFTAGPFECYDANRYLVGTAPPLQCTEGLISHPEGTYCTMACPQPLMSSSDYDAIEILISVLSWCSVFSCFLTITILLLFSRKRTQGPALALIFAVGMESSAGCIGTIIGHEDVWCGSDGTPNNFGDPWCTIQGIVNVFFELAGISLWFVIIVDIFLSLVLGPLFKGGNYRSSLNLRRDVEIFGKSLPLTFNPIAFSYVFFPMTLPLIPVIIALGAHQLGYDGSNLWCTIHSGSDVVIYTSETGIQTYVQGTGNPWNMALMTGPSVIVVLIGVVLLLAIFIYVFARTKGFKNRFVALFRLFLEQWRLMLFVFIFAVYYLIYLAFRINFETVKSEKYSDFGSYVKCTNNLYYQCISNARPSACSATCDIPSYVDFPFWVIVVLGKWGKGMAMFPIFGISKAMVKRIIKNSRTAILTSGGNSSDSRTNKGSLQKITGRIVNTLTEFTREESSEEPRAEKNSKGSMMDEIEEGDNSASSSSEEGSSEEEGTAMENIN